MTRLRVNWFPSLIILVLFVILGLSVYSVYSTAAYEQPKPPVVQVHVAGATVTYPSGWVNGHPDTLPVSDRVQHWVRIDTPAGYPLVMRGCLGGDGVYVSQAGSMFVVASDPECKTPDPPAKKLCSVAVSRRFTTCAGRTA